MKSKFIFIAALLLAACSGQEPVSFNTLEDARAQSRANAEFNAQAYRIENPRFDEQWKLVTHGDSTQTNDCPQGDGWASLSMMKVTKAADPNQKDSIDKFKIKCSTVSGALGCFSEEDFAKKQYAQDEGHCQPLEKVPFPLPKIAK